MPSPPLTVTSLEGLYRDHFTSLARLGGLAAGDGAVGEDAVQEVFAALYRKQPNLQDPAKALAYLRTAVLNRCRSSARRRSTGERANRMLASRTIPAGDVAERDGLAAATDEVVLAAVRALPGRQRDVILLRHWVGLDEAEIAATLGVSPGTVKTSASRARAALAPVLEELR